MSPMAGSRFTTAEELFTLGVPAEGLPRQYWHGAPDLCFEVVSPGETCAYVQEKACGWIRYGARMVVVVEPERRHVVVHRSDKDLGVLGEEDVFSGEDVLPGLKIPIQEQLIVELYSR